MNVKYVYSIKNVRKSFTTMSRQSPLLLSVYGGIYEAWNYMGAERLFAMLSYMFEDIHSKNLKFTKIIYNVQYTIGSDTSFLYIQIES